MIKPNERLTRQRLLQAMREGAILARSFDAEQGTTWCLASGRCVATSAAEAVLLDPHVRGCADCLWGEHPEDLAQTYRWIDDDEE